MNVLNACLTYNKHLLHVNLAKLRKGWNNVYFRRLINVLPSWVYNGAFITRQSAWLIDMLKWNLYDISISLIYKSIKIMRITKRLLHMHLTNE